MNTRSYSNIRLIGRAIMPSPTSLTICIVGSILLVSAGTLFQSLSIGTFLPNLFEGTWATAYTNTIVQPLTSITNSETWNSAAIIILWGITGLLVYTLIESVMYMISEWHKATRFAQFSEGVNVRRMHVREFLFRLFWRLVMIIGAFVLLVLLHPLFIYVFRAEHQFVFGMPLSKALTQLIYVIFIWVFIEHVCLVMLRLFTFRTRLFGDDKLL